MIKIKTLIIEDSDNDFRLMLRELHKGLFEIEYKLVEDSQGLETALQEEWDVIISDYSLPKFNGYDALKICVEKRPEIPFIMVSGVVGEAIAVDMMKYGARDYILKSNLTRLLPAIEREIADANIRKEKKCAEEAQEISEKKYRRIVNTAMEAMITFDNNGYLTKVNKKMLTMLGYSEEEMLGKKIELFLVEIEDKSNDPFLQMKISAQARDGVFERCFKKKNGETHWALVSSRALFDSNGKLEGSFAMLTDINERKKMEVALNKSQEVLTKFAALLDNMREEVRQMLDRKI